MVIDIYGANGNRYIDLSTLSPLLTYPQYRPIHNIDLSTILSFSMELLTLGLVFISVPKKNIILIFCCHLSPPSRVLEIFFHFGSEPWAHAPHLLLGPGLYTFIWKNNFWKILVFQLFLLHNNHVFWLLVLKKARLQPWSKHEKVYSKHERPCSNLKKGCPNMIKGCPKLEKECPKLKKECPKLEKVCPKLEKPCPKLEKPCPKLEKMCPKLEKICPEFSAFPTKVW